MDRIELTRRTAARLHAEAAALGSDPWKPYAFAIAEADRRGIDVEETAPGAALLDGGRATYVPGDRMILIERCGSDFDKAFLVAHEIGHIALGDEDGVHVALQVDALRPSEPTPVGVDRVVDYGRRQRREVQIDLFAREFLLPRPVLRAMHVDEGMSASAIAARTNAPFAAVAQQLLDALLLPTAEADAQPRLQKSLNQKQRQAASHRGSPYLLEAGPGTGKTQTLVARIEDLLDHDVDPRRILVLTFSNKAAAEMADRIADSRREAAAALWIGTFHAFGLDLVRRFHAELGLGRDPRMMDRTEAVELLEREFARIKLTSYRNTYDPTGIIVDMLAAISRAKDEVVGPRRHAELARAMLDAATTADAKLDAEKAMDVAKVYAVYEGLKADAGCIDFGDLVALPVELLEGNQAIAALLRATYDHVLVDEYQDVNRSSVRLLKALCGDAENLWAVGDARQSIYRFRGASSFNMTRFGTGDFAGATRGRLETNYRSVAEIVDAFSAFAAGMGGDGRLISDRGPGGSSPRVTTVDRAEQEVVVLADTITAMRDGGFAFRDQAVLSTGNEKLSRLGARLERLGIPVLFLGSLFERPEVKDLLCLLSILVDRRAMGLVRTACRAEFAMTIADVAAVMAWLRREDRTPGAWLEDLDASRGIGDAGKSGLAALATALTGFDSASTPWSVLAHILLDRTRIAADIANATGSADLARGIAIWQLMNFVRVQPPGKGLPIARLLDRVRRLVRLGDERDLRQLPAAAQSIDAVRLMTIHGAKGLEFGAVHVPGLNADTIPRTAQAPACPAPDGMIHGGAGSVDALFRAAHDEEQSCLFYVALSRARDRLFLYAPTKKSNDHNRPVSGYLGRLGVDVDLRHETPARACPVAPEDEEVAVAIDGHLTLGSAQIALYERCPRRFLYTHVLEVGGRRHATPFMTMHDAVRHVIEGIQDGTIALADARGLEDVVHEALVAEGLQDDGRLEDYAAMANAMVRYYTSTRDGATAEPAGTLSIAIGDDRILVRPDDVLLHPDGARVVRRVRTGHKRTADTKDVAAAAFLIAARAAFPNAETRFVHLADGAEVPVQLSTKETANRRAKLEGFVADVRRGRFPTKPSPLSCPGCPAFFVCGPTPPGVLQKNFRDPLPDGSDSAD